jgi:hypothetical protein
VTAAGGTEPPLRARRLIAFLALVLVVAAGLGVHALLPDTAATDIAADALYAGAAYLALVVVAPRWRAVAVGTLAAVWCVAVELFQLTGIPLVAGVAFPPAMLVLGTVFEPRDVAVYLLAIALITSADIVITRVRARRTAS